MQWDFPVTAGDYIVNLYFAEVGTNQQAVGARKFDVTIEGALALDDYDIFAEVGGFKGVVKSFNITSDTNLDIDFAQGHAEPADPGDRDPAPGTGPTNQAPTANAGTDQTITLPAGAPSPARRATTACPPAAR